MPEQKEELTIIGSLKTLMMLLVVLYHCAALWSNAGWFNQAPAMTSAFLPVVTEYLNDIHIYVFTFASGYLFYYTNFIKRNEFHAGTVIKKRFRKLIIPYIIITICWLLPFELIYFQESVLQLLFRFALGTAPRQLWFLLMLFMVNLMFCLWISLIKKKLSLRLGMIILYGVYIGGAFLIRFNVPDIFQIITSLRYLIFFFFGYALCRDGTTLLKKVNIVVVIILHLTVFALVYYLNHYCQHPVRLASVFLTPLISLSGIVVFYKIVGAVKCRMNRKDQVQKQNLIVLLFKKNEFSIYFFHQQWIWVVISLMNYEYISPYCIIVVGFVVSVVLSVLMSEGLKRIPGVKKALSI